MNTVKEGIRRSLADLLANSDKKKIDLAKACGVGRSAVTNWVNGESGIDIERIPAICDFFGVTIDEFFGRAHEMEPLSEKYRSILPFSSDEEELLNVYRALEPWERDLVLNHAKMVHMHVRTGK